MFKFINKKILTPIVLTIIILSVLIIIGLFIFKYFYKPQMFNDLQNYYNSRCEKDSDCKNTCCGCMSKNITCTKLCDVLPIRNCECKNKQCAEKISISNKEEAIEFAKNDNDFTQASNKFKLDFPDKNLFYSAYFYDKDKYWDVGVLPEGTLDLWYFIKFNNHGTIIEKGYGDGS